MKMMLDNATLSTASKDGEGEEGGSSLSTYVPTPAQREMIESEAFEVANFVSHRTAGKVRKERWLRPVIN